MEMRWKRLCRSEATRAAIPLSANGADRLYRVHRPGLEELPGWFGTGSLVSRGQAVFEPYLTCKVFGLVESPNNSHLELARRWSRKPSLVLQDDGSVQWDSETALEVEAERWYDAPGPMRFSTHNALIPMGHLGNASIIAFVSPVSVLPVSFRNAVPSYLRRLPEAKNAEVVDLAVRVYEIIKAGKLVIRAIDGVAYDGVNVVCRADRPSFFSKGIQNIPDLREFRAIEMDVLGQTAKLDANYNVSITDVSEEFGDITKCLKWLFDMLQPFTETRPAAPRTP